MQIEFEPVVKPMRPAERQELTDEVFRVIVAAEAAARREKTRRLREARESGEAVTSNQTS
jgi:hypothetical protein